MKKLVILLLLTSMAVIAAEQARSAPLVVMRMARQGYENVFWMEKRIKIGKQSVNGYIQGTGGADDSLMGFSFEEDWDMLVATIGFKSTTPEGREAEFFVEAGGKVLFSSGVIESKGPAQEIRVPIRGYKNVLLRISSERYNGTAGAVWGAPTVFDGLSDEEMKNDWSISINRRKTPITGSSAPSEVNVPFDVPLGEEVEYRVRIRRDADNRTVVVERERVER